MPLNNQWVTGRKQKAPQTSENEDTIIQNLDTAKVVLRVIRAYNWLFFWYWYQGHDALVQSVKRHPLLFISLK